MPSINFSDIDTLEAVWNLIILSFLVITKQVQYMFMQPSKGEGGEVILIFT
jgi:hypothetical protein